MTTEEDRTVYSFAKGEGEIRATLSVFRGRHLAGVRLYAPDESGEFRPTKKGVSVSVDQLPKLLEAVQQLCAAAGIGVEVAA